MNGGFMASMGIPRGAWYRAVLLPPRLWRDFSQACFDEETGIPHTWALSLLDSARGTWYRQAGTRVSGSTG